MVDPYTNVHVIGIYDIHVYIPFLSSRLKAYKNCILGYEKQSCIAIIIVKNVL